MKKFEYKVNIIGMSNTIDIRFECRGKDNLMGYFGGGWNYCLAVKYSKGTLYFQLIVFELRIDWKEIKK